jgi:AraC-like DNA-binding protein
VLAARGHKRIGLAEMTWWTIHGPEEQHLAAPCALVTTEEQLEGAGGARPFTFSARGRPFQAIEIHVASEELTTTPAAFPVRLGLDEAGFAAAFDVARLSEHDDHTLERTFATLLGHLAKQKLISRPLAEHARRPPAKAFALLWAALRPMIERLYLNPTLQEVGDASGVSTRQLDRYVQRFVTSFGLVGERWRSATLHIRLKLAIILLSADGATVSEVASAVGYGSSDAMARMFRDAGLPGPATVQQQVRAARDDLVPEA